MKYLIFDYNSTGHHLEYIHHLMEYVKNNNDQDDFIFCLSEEYKEKWELIDVPIANNIIIKYFNTYRVSELQRSNHFIRSYKLCKILSYYYKTYNPDKIILPDLIPYLPFLPLRIYKSRIINAIMYKIPRFRPNKSIISTIRDKIILTTLAKSKIFNRIFLLNDENSPSWYNQLYRTDVFSYLPDPINIGSDQTNESIQKPSDKIVLVHAGGLGKRKGTFVFLDTLETLSENERKYFKIRLIGEAVSTEDQKKIISYINKNKSSLDIYFSNEFVSFKDLIREIKQSDFVLIPYFNWEQSSGILGYAAYCNRPVIGPAYGLLGNLIKKYKLGITLRDISCESLRNILIKLKKNHNYENNYEEYYNSRSKIEFSKRIISGI